MYKQYKKSEEKIILTVILKNILIIMTPSNVS